jgi:VIT1/CCC1 family predicted Fe2+/Mn2+ transporter
MLDQKTKNRLLAAQKNEITEHLLYLKLSQSIKDAHNRGVLKQISDDELQHYHTWQKYTDKDVEPDRFKVWLYYVISRILGLTFGIKLMEQGESKAEATYEALAKIIPKAKEIAQDEEKHERELIGLIDEERLKYTGDMVRGLNVALIELTGVVAGLTFALQEKTLVIVAGLIAGISMSLSVAGTEYIATKSAAGSHSPIKAVFYGGLTNLITALFLIFPYFIFANVYLSLGFMILNAVIVIWFFSFYISVAKEISFRKRFTEMTLIGLGIAALSFVIGLLARTFLHIEI